MKDVQSKTILLPRYGESYIQSVESRRLINDQRLHPSGGRVRVFVFECERDDILRCIASGDTRFIQRHSVTRSLFFETQVERRHQSSTLRHRHPPRSGCSTRWRSRDIPIQDRQTSF